MTHEEKVEQAELIAEMVRSALTDIHHKTGASTECLLAGAHAQIVTQLGALFGGQLAAEQCFQAGYHIVHCAPAFSNGLATMPAAGTA